jgi:hypothetical protein
MLEAVIEYEEIAQAFPFRNATGLITIGANDNGCPMNSPCN